MFLYIGHTKRIILSASEQNIIPVEIEGKLKNMLFEMESLAIKNNKKLIDLGYPDQIALDLALIDQNK